MFIYVHFYIYECMINLTKKQNQKKPTNDNEITLKYSKNSITNQKYWQIIENDAFNDLKNSRMITIIMKYQKKNADTLCSYKKTVQYDPRNSDTYRAIQEEGGYSSYGQSSPQEVIIPVQTKVYQPNRLVPGKVRSRVLSNRQKKLDSAIENKSSKLNVRLYYTI